MAWLDKFAEDAERLFKLPREELRKFAEAMAQGDEEAVRNWAEHNGMGDKDFLVLATIYVLYRTEDKVSEILEGLKLRIDEAIALAGGLTAQLINGVEEDNRRVVLAQMLLAAALQISDRDIRNKIAEFARTLID